MPLERTSQTLRYIAAWTLNGAPVTGLSPTITVYDPTPAAVVTNAAMTEIGNGIYYYDLSNTLTAAAGEYPAVMRSGNASLVDTDAVYLSYSLARAGVNNLDAAISTRLATAGYTAPPTTGAIADAVAAWDNGGAYALPIGGAVNNASENSSQITLAAVGTTAAISGVTDSTHYVLSVGTNFLADHFRGFTVWAYDTASEFTIPNYEKRLVLASTAVVAGSCTVTLDSAFSQDLTVGHTVYMVPGPYIPQAADVLGAPIAGYGAGTLGAVVGDIGIITDIVPATGTVAGDVWDALIAGYLRAGSTGEALAAAAAAGGGGGGGGATAAQIWNLLLTSTGTTADSIGELVKEKLGLIGTVSMEVSSPVAQDGFISLVRGDSYLAEDSRAISFTFTGTATLPDFTGATAHLLAGTMDLTTATITLNGTTGFTVAFDLPATQWVNVPNRSYKYQVMVAQADGDILTYGQGNLHIAEAHT